MSRNIKVPFYELYDYWTRFAVYWFLLLEKTGISYQMLMPCISKEEVPDFDVLRFDNPQRIKYEIEQVEKDIAYIKQIKEGKFEPIKCGECDTCRENKVLTNTREATSLI